MLKKYQRFARKSDLKIIVYAENSVRLITYIDKIRQITIMKTRESAFISFQNIFTN